MSRAIGYIRVSMRGQGYETKLVRDQTDRIRAWCEMNDVAFEHACVDSGSDLTRMDDRPGLAEALERLGKGALLVVCSLKKLSPSVRDVGRIAQSLQEKGAALVSLKEEIDTTTPGGAMVLRALAAVEAMADDPAPPRTPPVAVIPPPEPEPDPYGFERRRGERRRAERRRTSAGAEAASKRSVLDTPISELLWRRSEPEGTLTFSATWAQTDGLVKKGQTDRAIRLWQRFLDRTQGNEAGMALQYVGDLLLKRNRVDDAVDHFLRASGVFRDLGLFSKAIASLKRVRKLQPGRADIYVRIGKLSALCDKVGDATAAYLEVAGRLLGEGDREGALGMFSRVRMLDPVNARHRLQLAAEMIERGVRDTGIEEALHGIDLLRMVGDRDAAERHLAALLELEPQRGDVRARLEAVRRGDPPAECPEGAESGVDGSVNLLTRADRDRRPGSAWRRSLDFAPVG